MIIDSKDLEDYLVKKGKLRKQAQEIVKDFEVFVAGRRKPIDNPLDKLEHHTPQRIISIPRGLPLSETIRILKNKTNEQT